MLRFFSYEPFVGLVGVDSVALKLQDFPYGSVPLKTYFPDGDIDVTTLVVKTLTMAWYLMFLLFFMEKKLMKLLNTK